ncbi:MAG: DUF1801 domain-containing protein [Planctomycetota bacterium]|jgi:hypothetical protein
MAKKRDWKSITEYLDSLPDDRRAAMKKVRAVMRKNLGKGFKEGIQYGMPAYFVPHSVYPPGYHCDRTQPLPFASFASQKNHMAVYLMCIYGNPEEEAWFRKEWAKTGKKLDMGKSCIRFKKLEDCALDVIGKAIKRVTVKKYIKHYEEAIAAPRPKRPAKKKVAKKKAAPKKKAARRKAAKKR